MYIRVKQGKGLFVLMLNIPVNNFKLYRDFLLSSWVEPVLNRG